VAGPCIVSFVGYNSLYGLNDGADFDGFFVGRAVASGEDEEDDLIRAGAGASVGRKETVELGDTSSGRLMMKNRRMRTKRIKGFVHFGNGRYGVAKVKKWQGRSDGD